MAQLMKRLLTQGHQRENSQTGGALIGAVLFSALMLSLSAIIFKSTISKKNLIQNLEASLNLREATIKKIRERDFQTVNKQTPKLEKEIFKAESFEASFSWVNKRIGFPSPDWNLLESLPKKDCHQSSQRAGATAALSCPKLEEFVPAYGGNIQNRQDQVLNLPLYFIRGDFEIDGTLVLNPNNPITLVIVVGKIKVKEIYGEDQQKLILYSATSSIEITENVSPPELCEDPMPSLKLSLMAPGNKSINGRKEESSPFMGCSPQLNETLWPKETLLAYKLP